MPRLSIIVPVFRAEEFYDTFFRCLRDQDVIGNDYELIVVDNTDGESCFSILENYCKESSNFSVVTFREVQSSYAARNYGASLAQSDILVFTDIDCRPRSDWLRNILTRVENCPDMFLLSGKIDLVPEGANFNIYEWFDKCSSLRQKKYALEGTGTTANLVVSKKAFLAVDGFLAIESGADREFCRRVMAQTASQFVFAPDCLVFHPARASYREISKKLRRVARGVSEVYFVNATFSNKCTFLLKQIVGIFLMPNQWRILSRTLKCYPVSTWFLKFSLITLFFGFYSRIHIITNCLFPMRKG